MINKHQRKVKQTLTLKDIYSYLKLQNNIQKLEQLEILKEVVYNLYLVADTYCSSNPHQVTQAGFAGAVVGTKVNGGSWSQAFSNGVKGAVIGAVSAVVANGIGEAFGHSTSFFNASGIGGYGNALMKSLAHGISRAVLAKAQGQKVSSGFWSGFVASGFAASKGMGKFTGTMLTATVSGTISRITGGKFANGAVSGAFVHLFNAWARDRDDYAVKKAMYGGQSKYTRQKNAFNMFDGVSDVGDYIEGAGGIARNPL